MLRFCSFCLFLFCFFSLFAQEEIISPLETNLNGISGDFSQKRSNLIDSTITYVSDTLTFETPFIEDFSISHFQKFPSIVDYNKLSKSVYYKIIKKRDMLKLKTYFEKFESLFEQNKQKVEPRFVS